MNKNFKVVDGRLVELGPRVIEVTPDDMREWHRLREEWRDTDLRWSLLPAFGMGACGGVLVAIIIVLTFITHVVTENTIYVSFALLVALVTVIKRYVVGPRREKAKAEFEKKRQALLAKYGVYKRGDVQSYTEWLASGSLLWGRDPYRYVLIEKGDV